MTQAALVRMQGITKRFPGVIANENVSFSVRPGEIHALLGENGAGKSTLMSILAGLYRPDEGELFVGEKRMHFRSPRDASRAGIGMIHQHFKLVQPLSVAENVVLGTPRLPLLFDARKVANSIAEFAASYDFKIDPLAKIWQLSVGEQQRVEIIKVLYRGAKILVLDEPTTVLTPGETRELFTAMRNLTDHGCAIVMITHKMEEVLEIADTISVLRKGRLVGERTRAEATETDLAKMMVGREVLLFDKRATNVKGDEILRLDNVNAQSDRGLAALDNISLHIREGEILGVAGVAGNGQKELAEIVAGLRPVSAGRMRLKGTDVTGHDVRSLTREGIRFVPEDRLGMGLVANMNIIDNLLLKDYCRREYSRGPWINRRHARAVAARMVDKFNVYSAGLDAPVRLMSGGNMQKLLFAREVTSRNAHLLIASYPVRGLDIGATDNVYNLLLGQRERGRGVLFITEDLDALLSLSDRIIVMFEGRIMGEFPAKHADIEKIGLLMAGKSVTEGVA